MSQTAIKLTIEGMHCAACVRRVTVALNKLLGVHPQRVDIGEATMDYDAATLQPQAIVDAVDAIGFSARIALETNSVRNE
jgi:copper chaperone